MGTVIWSGGVSGNWSTAANWSTGAVPVAADDVVFENNIRDVDAGLDQSAVTLTSLTIRKSYTGKIGTPTSYLQVGATNVFIGQYSGPGTPAGSSRLKLNLGAVASTVIIYDTAATGADPNYYPVRLLCNHAATVITIYGGRVGIAEDDTATTYQCSQLQIGSLAGGAAPISVVVGPDFTAQTMYKYGGDLTWYGTISGGAATMAQFSGTMRLDTASAIAAILLRGGTLYGDRCGTISTLTHTAGTFDTTRNAGGAFTITTYNVSPNATCHFRRGGWTVMTNKLNVDNTEARRVRLSSNVLAAAA